MPLQKDFSLILGSGILTARYRFIEYHLQRVWDPAKPLVGPLPEIGSGPLTETHLKL